MEPDIRTPTPDPDEVKAGLASIIEGLLIPEMSIDVNKFGRF